MRFPGQWFQLEAGFHHNWHRTYDPSTGRYLQPDPLGMPDGPSRWAYARSAATMYVDPTGEWIQFIPYAYRAARTAWIAYRIYSFARHGFDERCYISDSIVDGLLAPPRWGHGGFSPDLEVDPNEIAGIRGVRPHPDGTVGNGRKPQYQGYGGIDQAMRDFQAAVGEQYTTLPGGRLRGTGPSGENVIFNPESTGGLGPNVTGPPTLYVNGSAIRYE